MSKTFITVLGKSVKKAAKLRGGGSALPGLVVEKIDPNFMQYTLSRLPLGVVVISGTNGKTTTTKMVVELLRSQGLKVFTNRTGSNFTRGVVAALLDEVDIRGRLNADIAVLELDEAYAVNFTNSIHPRFCLLLNVMRDQLDRFGEINYTAELLQNVASQTTDTVVLNREDPRIANIAQTLKEQKIMFFGLSDELKPLFPNDDELHQKNQQAHSNIKADVVLSQISPNTKQASFLFGEERLITTLKLNGIYNMFNVAAALALLRAILGEKLDKNKLCQTLPNITPAFGRGETLNISNQPVELILVKNPAGFRLGLQSFDSMNYATMIAINDNYADGRDMSWLWDVDFSSLKKTGVSQVAGIRAYDMALRLHYDEISIKNINLNIKKALQTFLKNNSEKPKRIYCTYTAMLAIRRALSKLTAVEKIK